MTDNEIVTFQQAGEAVVARLSCPELTSDIGDEIYRRLREPQCSGPAGRLVVDLSELKFIGSIGLSILVKLTRHAKACGGTLALAGLHGHCLDVVRVVGLTKALALYPSVQAALEADVPQGNVARTLAE
ncbi:MAG: STAS domain-containing protein [Phycisphaerae bacterium]